MACAPRCSRSEVSRNVSMIFGNAELEIKKTLGQPLEPVNESCLRRVWNWFVNKTISEHDRWLLVIGVQLPFSAKRKKGIFLYSGALMPRTLYVKLEMYCSGSPTA